MSAEATSGDRPANQHTDLITKFRDEYRDVLANAVVSHEHTHTIGWQKLYGDERREEQNRRRLLCQSLEDAAQSLQLRGSSEDDEKSIAEIKKSMTAMRERREAFDRTTVAPVMEPVTECENAIEKYITQARHAEQNAPLHNVGLEHLMRSAVSEVSKASWNEEAGIVELSK